MLTQAGTGVGHQVGAALGLRVPPAHETWGLTFLRGRLQDQRLSLLNEMQLLSHMAGSERVVTCDHDHLGRRQKLRRSELQPGDMGAESLLRKARERDRGLLLGTGLPGAIRSESSVYKQYTYRCLRESTRGL